MWILVWILLRWKPLHSWGDPLVEAPAFSGESVGGSPRIHAGERGSRNMRALAQGFPSTRKNTPTLTCAF
jgi:hypothetical protein